MSVAHILHTNTGGTVLIAVYRNRVDRIGQQRYLRKCVEWYRGMRIFGISKADEQATQAEKETNCKVDFQVTDFNVKM